jgi:hypothetical protein
MTMAWREAREAAGYPAGQFAGNPDAYRTVNQLLADAELEGPQLPVRADLDAATAATAAILADPGADLMDRYRAAQTEAAIYEAAPAGLVIQAETETEAEVEI